MGEQFFLRPEETNEQWKFVYKKKCFLIFWEPLEKELKINLRPSSLATFANRAFLVHYHYQKEIYWYIKRGMHTIYAGSH